MANEIYLDYWSTSATLVLEIVRKWTPRDVRDFGSWTTLFLFHCSYPGSSNSLITIYFTWSRLPFLNLKVSSKAFPNQTLMFFHRLECKPHMPPSWIGSSFPAFCRDSEWVLRVLIPLPSLRAERCCSEYLRMGWKGYGDLTQTEPVI